MNCVTQRNILLGPGSTHIANHKFMLINYTYLVTIMLIVMMQYQKKINNLQLYEKKEYHNNYIDIC